MIEDRFVVSDYLWVRLEPQLPGKASDSGVTAQNNRLFLEAVFWRVRTGSPWRDLPSQFGIWNSQFRRFRRWAKSGVFESLFKAMSDDPDLEYALIPSRAFLMHCRAMDGTIVQVLQKASGAKGGPKLMPFTAPLVHVYMHERGTFSRRANDQGRGSGGCSWPRRLTRIGCCKTLMHAVPPLSSHPKQTAKCNATTTPKSINGGTWSKTTSQRLRSSEGFVRFLTRAGGTHSDW